MNEEGLVDRITARYTSLEFHYDHHDKAVHALYTDMTMPSREDFEELVRLWRRFYEIVPDDFVSKWNKSTRRRIEEAESTERDKSGYVYLAKSETGHFKIGLSINPAKRIKIFDTKMPVAVELVHTIPADDMRQAEGILHGRFADKRHEGEWFNLDQGDVAYVRKLTAFFDGRFSVAEL